MQKPLSQEDIRMNSAIYAALAALVALPAAAQDGPPRGTLPPNVVTQINLGGAGLLPLFYADNQFGLTQSRNGKSRARIGDASGPDGPVGDYQHSSHAVTLPVTLRYGLPDQKSFVTFKGVYNRKNEDPNLTSAEARLTNFLLGYQYFFSPTGMVAASIGTNELESNAPAVKVERESVDLRLDYLQRLSDNWGFAGRVLYSMGDTTLTVKKAGLKVKQNDDYVYAQAEVAGNFTKKDADFIPAGYALRPLVGFSLQDGTLGDAKNNFGGDVYGKDENTGSVWAKGTLTKLAPPGKIAPFGTLGIEHVYKDSNKAFIDDDTYTVLGLGVAYQSKGGTNLSLTYDGRHGFNGKREYNSVVAAAVFTF